MLVQKEMKKIMSEQELEEKLIVGTKLKIGKQYSEEFGFEENEIIELIEGYFEYDKLAAFDGFQFIAKVFR